MTDHTLLPCPFCGGKAGVIQLTGHASPRTVACDECHCRSCWGTEEEVIAAWNRRTPPAAVPDGWVLVPKEPTREMAIAAAKALDDITVDDPKAAAWDAMRAYRAMLSAAPTPPVDDGWRPIETAPKDGTDVLLWDGEEIFVGYWSDSILVSPGAWVKEEHRSDTVTYIPTHWMPLPAAPTEGGNDEHH